MDNRFEYGNNNSVSGQNFSNNTSVNAGGGNGESQNFGYSSPKNNSLKGIEAEVRQPRKF